MRNLLQILLLFVAFTSCKTTSVIITSKSVAEKQGIYKNPENTVTVKQEKKKKKIVEKAETITAEISPQPFPRD